MTDTRNQAARPPVGGLARWIVVRRRARRGVVRPAAVSVLLVGNRLATHRTPRELLQRLHEPDGPGECRRVRHVGLSFGMTVVAIFAGIACIGLTITARVRRRTMAAARGLAHGAELAPFSAKAMVKRSQVILGEHDPNPARSGIRLGVEKFSKRDVWIPKESTLLVLAPPRSGKTSGTVAPAVIAHDGPVVATGVRDDIMVWTHPWRRHTGGPMWVCEPMRRIGPPASRRCPSGALVTAAWLH